MPNRIAVTSYTISLNRCCCGGSLEFLPLMFMGRLRWARRCRLCGALWSSGGWHHQADEVRQGTAWRVRAIT